MNEVQSGLIEMNAHMVMEKWANNLAVLGFMIFGIIVILFIVDLALEPAKTLRKYWYSYLIALILSLCIAMIGFKTPRVKIIKACASGPISIEQIAIKYDVIKVDGKELTLRER